MNFENEQYGKCWFCGNSTLKRGEQILCSDEDCGGCMCDGCISDDCAELPIPYADLGLEDEF